MVPPKAESFLAKSGKKHLPASASQKIL